MTANLLALIALLYGAFAFAIGVLNVIRWTESKAMPWEIAAALIWPIWLAAIASNALFPWTEEARLDRRIRDAERENRLLGKRHKAEAAEARYRASIDRMLDGNAPVPEPWDR